MFYNTKVVRLFGLSLLICCSFLTTNAQGNLVAYNNKPIQIPVEFNPSDLYPGAEIKISTAMPAAVACTGGSTPVGGFTQCAGSGNAIPAIDRNDWWNCCAPPNWLPSEAYEYNFPSIETDFPCVSGATVDELILTITINSVTFDLGSPYACCEQYLEGVFGNLYDNCPTGSPCGVVGDGVVNNGNPGIGDCSPSGDNLSYDGASSSFPLGLPYTSTTTCLSGLISTGDQLGVDIIPSFRYDEAAANGCNCTQDLISQGFVTIDYELEVEYVFCSDQLPAGCFPTTFTQVDPLCESDSPVNLPTTSNNGYNGTWNPATIDPAGQGGNTITAIFTPDPNQCISGGAEMDVVINEDIVPTFTQIPSLCDSDPPVNLPGSSTNGVSGSWDVGATFDPSGQGGNTVTITFTPDAGQCAGTTTMDIEVLEDTEPTFDQIGPICETDSPVSLPGTSTNGITGSWDVGFTFDPAGQGGNTVTITFTANPGQCSGTTTMDIVVEEEIVPMFTPIGPLCESDPAVSLPFTSNNGITGSWDVGSTFDPSGQGGNVVTLTFTPNSSECASVTTLDVTVEEEVMPSFNPIGPLCENDPPFNLPTVSNNGIAGTWDVGATLDPSGQGGTTVTINFTPAAGECGTSLALQVDIEEEITPTFDPIGPLCENDPPFNLPTVSNNGIAGTWDVGATLDPSGQGGTTATITFFPAAGACANSQTINVTIEAEQVPAFIAIGPVCETDPAVTLPTTSLNGITGTWDVGPTFNPSGQGGNNVTINFTPDPGQCATSANLNIVVLVETIPTFNPIGPFCTDDPIFNLPASSLEGIDGSWNIGPFFDPSSNAGLNNLIFSPFFGECGAEVIVPVIVNEVPTYTVVEVACNAGFLDYQVTLETSADDVSSNQGTVTANGSGSFTIDGIPEGVNVEITLLVTATGCSEILDITSPDCNCPTVPAPNGDDVEYCEGSSIPALEATAGAGLQVNWYDQGTGGTLLLGNSNTYTPAGPGTYYAESEDPSNGCQSAVRTAISLIAIPLDTTYNTASSCDPAMVGMDTTVYMTMSCDSIVITTTTLSAADTMFATATTCDPLLVGLDTTTYTTATCDSVVVTNTSLLLGDETNLTASSCDPLLVGMDTVIMMNQAGCDSLIITTTTLSAADTMFATAGTCDPLLVGLDTMTFATATCDSVVITNTSLLAGDETNLTASSCDPAMVGMDTVIMMNQAGCDSLIITTTTLSAADTMFATAGTCDPLLVGLDTMTFATATCDSVVITNTSLLAGDETNLMASSCDPAMVGMDTVIMMNQAGCDSLIITTTTLSPADTMFATAGTCDPLLVGLDTTTYATANCDSVVITNTSLLLGDETNLTASSCDPLLVGMDTVIMMNQAGCDSLVITTTTLSPADTMFATASTCDPFLVGLDTVIYTTSTCDSVVITNTSLMQGDETFLTANSCDPMAVGIDTVVMMNQAGCDSLVITTTDLILSDTTYSQAMSCNLMAIGLDTIIYNTAGCDSVVIVETTLTPGDETFLNESSCDLNEVGSDTLFLTNLSGCDSLVYIETSFSDADTTFLQSSTCDINLVGADTIVFNTPTCDSIVITNTALLPGAEVNLTDITCDPLQAGLDTVILTSQNGCDSLIITNYNLITIAPTLINDTTCDPAMVGVDSTIFNTSSCDSLVVVTTTLVNSTESVLTLSTCLVDEVGADTVFLSNAAGCDSLVITNTILSGIIENVDFNSVDPSCLTPFGFIEILNVTGGTPPYVYSIDGGTTFTATSSWDMLSAGNYEIIIQDGNDCQESLNLTLNDVGEPELFFNPSTLNLNLGESVTLSPQTNIPDSDLMTIDWGPVDFLSCTNCLDPLASPLNNTSYTLTLTDVNGCEVSASVLLNVTENTRVYLPNVFSPNGDGLNDFFTVYADEGLVEQVNKLLIFDRWGDNVFLLNDFQPNDESIGWDGNKKGQPVEQGVHVYLAEILLVNGSKVLLEGEITIIR